MKRCLQLAAKGMGSVAPNPLVGSVIVQNGKIIGEGFHTRFGEAHAEVNAIRSVSSSEALREATLYVNLEPCAHQGKTPPCADLIIAKGIPRVFVGQADPNTLVAGRGLKKLRDAGVEVITGVLEKECLELNCRFNTFHEKKRPFIILKWAQSADGYMDVDRTEKEKGTYWISHPETKKLVHMWRSQERGILVGGKTIENDNPRLDVRMIKGADPIRIILAGRKVISSSSHVISDGKKTVVFGTCASHHGKNVETIELGNEASIKAVLDTLHEKGIDSILVEGGKNTLERFIESGLWDEARTIISPQILQSGLKAPELKLPPLSAENYGNDRILTYRNR